MESPSYGERKRHARGGGREPPPTAHAQSPRRLSADRRTTGARFFVYLLQVDLQIARVLIPPVGVLLQTACKNPFDLPRKALRDLRRRLRLTAQNGRQDRSHGVASESAPAREDLVQDCAETENIGPRID